MCHTLHAFVQIIIVKKKIKTSREKTQIHLSVDFFSSNKRFPAKCRLEKRRQIHRKMLNYKHKFA